MTVIKRDGQSQQQQQSKPFWDVLKKHLAIFGEHYRQPISELSVIAYAEDLASLTVEQLDSACTHARQNSEFMPVSAVILQSHKELQSSSRETYLGVPQLKYPTVPQEERDQALRDMSETVERLRGNLGVTTTDPPKKKLAIRPSTLSIEEQKEELKRRGLL